MGASLCFILHDILFMQVMVQKEKAKKKKKPKNGGSS